jgi:hypothetical protein
VIKLGRLIQSLSHRSVTAPFTNGSLFIKGSLIPDFVKFTVFVQIAQILANQPFRLTSLVLHPEAHFSGNRNSLKYTCLCVKNSRKSKVSSRFSRVSRSEYAVLCSIYAAYWWIRDFSLNWTIEFLCFCACCTKRRFYVRDFGRYIIGHFDAFLLQKYILTLIIQLLILAL